MHRLEVVAHEFTLLDESLTKDAENYNTFRKDLESVRNEIKAHTDRENSFLLRNDHALIMAQKWRNEVWSFDDVFQIKQFLRSINVSEKIQLSIETESDLEKQAL